jgi:hypothetical protein
MKTTTNACGPPAPRRSTAFVSFCFFHHPLFHLHSSHSPTLLHLLVFLKNINWIYLSLSGFYKRDEIWTRCRVIFDDFCAWSNQLWKSYHFLVPFYRVLLLSLRFFRPVMNFAHVFHRRKWSTQVLDTHKFYIFSCECRVSTLLSCSIVVIVVFQTRGTDCSLAEKSDLYLCLRLDLWVLAWFSSQDRLTKYHEKRVDTLCMNIVLFLLCGHCLVLNYHHGSFARQQELSIHWVVRLYLFLLCPLSVTCSLLPELWR